ncbi:hypothetical protein [Acinetobacter sp.]|uniref:hypothetical protein n=1 Tax=Acinetobacter sp. TaxID=472 RepID=UPI00257D00B4|nr:hypothetical protein [Acinetobacter sp.]
MRRTQHATADQVNIPERFQMLAGSTSAVPVMFAKTASSLAIDQRFLPTPSMQQTKG